MFSWLIQKTAIITGQRFGRPKASSSPVKLAVLTGSVGAVTNSLLAKGGRRMVNGFGRTEFAV